MDAEYYKARSTIGACRAGLQYWRELFSPALFRLRREFERNGSTNIPHGVDPSGQSHFRTRVNGFLSEMQYGFRSLMKTPGFTFIAVLSLAVGIGVNTAVFTGIDAVWLAPVPGVVGEEEVVEIIAVDDGSDRYAMTYPDFVALTEAETPLVAVAGWSNGGGTLGTDEGGVRVSLIYATPNYNRVLGVIPALGRDFLATDDIGPGSPPVAIVSHDLWQNRFAGDEHIIGRYITLNRIPHTVVGVAPEEFKGTRPTWGANDVWVPLSQSPRIKTDAGYAGDRNSIWVNTLGRMNSGTNLAETNAALRTIFGNLADDYPETNGDRIARAAAFGRFPAQNRIGDMLAVGMLAGLLVVLLLIICGNLAGMTLARSAVREREIAVRLALGSSRGRLVTHLMVEAFVLAALGGAVGILVAFWGMPLVRPASLGITAPGVSFVPNGGILAASLVLTFLAALAFGLLPALRFSSPELVSSLKDDSGGGGRRVGRVHRIATSAQTGMAMLGLVIAALFARSLGSMADQEIGFQPEHLLVSRLTLSEEAYPSVEEGGDALFDRLGQSIGALPGVESVTFADGVPLDMSGWNSWVTASGADDAGGSVRAEYTRITERFFETIGTPILTGRGIARTDISTSEQVAVITKSLAERLWPGEDPIGRQFQRPVTREEGVTTTVVGVVGNVASSRADRPLPSVFIPLRQNYGLGLMIVIKSRTEVGALVGSVRSAILAFDRGLPAPDFVTSESLVARSAEAQKGIAGLGGGLGLLTLILSAFGVYGVAAFAVTNRTREIGMRMAMGATREQVLRSFLRDAVRLALPGLVVGGLLAAAMAVAMQSMLYGLSPLDPISFGIAAVVLFAVVLLASLVPSLRASRVNPMDALRWE
jgi:predicted permease